MNVAERFAADLALTCGSRSHYLETAQEMLNALIPSDAIAWIGVDFGTGRSEVAGTSTGLRDSEVADRLVKVKDDHPMVLSFLRDPTSMAARRMSDIVSTRALLQTKAWSVLLKPVQGRHQMSIPTVRFSALGSRSWSLNRARGDFSVAEQERLQLLGPSLRLLDLAYASPRPDAARMEEYQLTGRERDVLRLVSTGMTAAAIGHVLGISRRTVTKHLEHAYLKLGCHDRVSACRLLGFTPAT